MSIPKFIYEGESEKQAKKRAKHELVVARAQLESVESVEDRLVRHLRARIVPETPDGQKDYVYIARRNGALDYVKVTYVNGTFDCTSLLYVCHEDPVEVAGDQIAGLVHVHPAHTGVPCLHFADGYARLLTSKGELSYPYTCYVISCDVIDLDLTPEIRKKWYDECKRLHDLEVKDIKNCIRLLKNHLIIHKLRSAIRALGNEPPAIV